jgi:nucleotide-binding universal stress UspA family protein
VFRRILVTLDGSRFAEAALPAALELARKAPGQIRLLTVQDPGWAFGNEAGWRFEDEGATETARKSARRYIEDVRERIEPLCPQVTTVVREGYTSDEILDEADAFGADVLVMATHGRGPIARLWLGSVASACARKARRPTLLIHPMNAGSLEGAESVIRRIVVPLDGSELSERALGRGTELAMLFRCPLELVRVVPAPWVADPEFFPRDVAQAEAALEKQLAAAVRYLDRKGAAARAWGVEVSTQAVAAVDAGPAIVEAAGGDAIVMTTRARTGFDLALMGSVADAVVRAATGPVLVIPPTAASATRTAA